MTRYPILLLLPILFFSCSMEPDYSDCQDLIPCEFDFSLVGSGNRSDFQELIRHTELIVCGPDKALRQLYKTEENMIRITLPAGTYHAVCWSNRSANTLYKYDRPVLDEAVLEVDSPETCCPLYYAPQNNLPLTFEVKSGEENRHTLEFVRAHHTLGVYIKGLDQLEASDGEAPSVELTHMPYIYDMSMCPSPNLRSYERECWEWSPVRLKRDQTIYYSFIHTPSDEISPEATLNIRRSGDRQILYSMSLKEYVEANEIRELDEIEVLFTFRANAEVSVTLPDWDEVIVEPLPPVEGFE